MSRVRNLISGGLTAALFYVSAACSNQESTQFPIQTPSPTAEIQIKPQLQTSNNLQTGYSNQINSIKFYQPSENELQIAEAVKYIQQNRHRSKEPITNWTYILDTQLGIDVDSIRTTVGIPTGKIINGELQRVIDTDSGIVTIGVYDRNANYDLAIPFFDDTERTVIEKNLKGTKSLKIKRPEKGELIKYPHNVLSRSKSDYPVVGSIVDNFVTVVADKDWVIFSSEQVFPTLNLDNALHNYPADVTQKAMKLADFIEGYGRYLPVGSFNGNALSIEQLQRELDASLFETSIVIDEVFDPVLILNVDNQEMVEFRNAIDSYKEFKEASGFGTNDHPNMDPNLKSALTYFVVFSTRSIYQDPLTAHKYAFAIANDPTTRDGVAEMTYDVYFEVNGMVEGVSVKLDQINSSIKSVGAQKITENVQRAKGEVMELQETLKQQGHEIKVKTAAELRRVLEQTKTETIKKSENFRRELENTNEQAREDFHEAVKSANNKLQEAKEFFGNHFGKR